MKHKQLIFIISCIILILLSALMIFMNFQEWIKIDLLKQFDNYPFGGEGPVPYYYKSAELYSRIMLVWGLLFLSNLTFGIISIIKKKKLKTYLTLGILFLLIIAQFLHGLQIPVMLTSDPGC
jgi:hypothetical protein